MARGKGKNARQRAKLPPLAPKVKQPVSKQYKEIQTPSESLEHHIQSASYVRNKLLERNASEAKIASESSASTLQNQDSNDTSASCSNSMIVDSIEESVTDAEKDGAPKKFAITDYKFFELLKPRRPKPILHRILIRHLSSLAVDHPDIEIQAKKEAETRKQETDKELAETAIRRREARRLLSGIKVLRRPPYPSFLNPDEINWKRLPMEEYIYYLSFLRVRRDGLRERQANMVEIDSRINASLDGVRHARISIIKRTILRHAPVEYDTDPVRFIQQKKATERQLRMVEAEICGFLNWKNGRKRIDIDGRRRRPASAFQPSNPPELH